MEQFKPTPDNSIDLEFRVERFDFSVYEVQSQQSGVTGILRVGVIPIRITRLIESVNGKPQFHLQSFNLISFVNKGKYGTPDETIMSPEDLEKTDKVELEEGIDYNVLAEAPNIFLIINSRPPYFKIRAKSTLTKVELIERHYDYFGNPLISVQVNIGVSYSFYSPKT